MKRLLLALALLSACALAQAASIRSIDQLRPDATWAGREAVATLRSDGMQGLIAKINHCYETTADPAFRCTYLASAAAYLDTSAAHALGISGYLNSYFNPDVLLPKVMSHYKAAGIDEKDATTDITNALLITTKIADEAALSDGDPSTPAASANGTHEIPSHCKSAETKIDVLQQVPNLVGMPQGSINDVTFLADEPRQIWYPAVHGQPARYILQCPVKVVWNSGHVDYKTYVEKQNEYGQVEVQYNDIGLGG